MSDQKILKVTSMEDLVRASQGTLIELPAFAPDIPFIAKLKRPSLLSLLKEGKIPNQLISTANELFGSGKVDTEDDESLSNLFGVLDSICEAAFVEPTYEEIKASGVTLTDEQLMAVFNYTQRGVSALSSFRKES